MYSGCAAQRARSLRPDAFRIRFAERRWPAEGRAGEEAKLAVSTLPPCEGRRDALGSCIIFPRRYWSVLGLRLLV